MQRIANLPLAEREREISSEILHGNVPEFWRTFVPVTLKEASAGKTNVATIFVSPDYLAVGADEDYFLAPLTPQTAQRIADELGCTLPTRRMVDAIYSAASVKLSPLPIAPSPEMTSVTVFAEHDSMVRTQRSEALSLSPPGGLIAGHKKDVVISNRLTNAPGKVAIYGWHKLDGKPIQPLYVGHADPWVDYSHGVRLVRQELLLNGVSNRVASVLADAELAGVLSDEGVMRVPRYSIDGVASSPFRRTNAFGEEELEFAPVTDVRVRLNSPARLALPSVRPVKLVLYALPNGNTIEQTAGRRLRPGDDWHFDIQHIAAQMRFVRTMDTNSVWLLAYVEAAGKSWPAWRKKHAGDKTPISAIIEAIKQRCAEVPSRLVLSGHSGGGSFIFGYLNEVERIPDTVERVAFLDSTYGYDPALGHGDKLGRWLASSEEHCLSVLAYNDTVALLDGKPFVSATGGTWYRSQLMQTNLAAGIAFSAEAKGELRFLSALQGRVSFIFKENPERKIFHTVQVDKNGFIQTMFSGTPLEGRGYSYFGDRAYDAWIGP